jgi:hypothetical protein
MPTRRAASGPLADRQRTQDAVAPRPLTLAAAAHHDAERLRSGAGSEPGVAVPADRWRRGCLDRVTTNPDRAAGGRSTGTGGWHLRQSLRIGWAPPQQLARLRSFTGQSSRRNYDGPLVRPVLRLSGGTLARMARLEQAKGAQTDESRSFAVACNRRSLRHLGCDASCRLASSSRSMPEHRSHAHLLGVR